MKREIVKNLWIGYKNKLKQYHREKDKPTFISFDGYITFRKNANYHRKGKPAIILLDGSFSYYENGEFVKSIQR